MNTIKFVYISQTSFQVCTSTMIIKNYVKWHITRVIEFLIVIKVLNQVDAYCKLSGREG